jgi:hypothetical protein
VPFTPRSRSGDVLDSESARAIVLRYLPMVADLITAAIIVAAGRFVRAQVHTDLRMSWRRADTENVTWDRIDDRPFSSPEGPGPRGLAGGYRLAHTRQRASR